MTTTKSRSAASHSTTLAISIIHGEAYVDERARMADGTLAAAGIPVPASDYIASQSARIAELTDTVRTLNERAGAAEYERAKALARVIELEGALRAVLLVHDEERDCSRTEICRVEDAARALLGGGK